MSFDVKMVFAWRRMKEKLATKLLYHAFFLLTEALFPPPPPRVKSPRRFFRNRQKTIKNSNLSLLSRELEFSVFFANFWCFFNYAGRVFFVYVSVLDVPHVYLNL